MEPPCPQPFLYMSMSLDGFVAAPNEGPDNGLGDGGHRLHEWAFTGADADQSESWPPVGCERPGVRRNAGHRRGRCRPGTFEPAGGWGGDHHDGVPIFILTRHDPADVGPWPLVTYVNDVTTAMTEAKEAGGDKNVLVHGAGTAQLALAASVLDELELHVIPGALRPRAPSLRGPRSKADRAWSARGSSRERAVSHTCTTGSSAEVGGPRLPSS
jgi:dihydrofolate reductase